jgi:hypothetical protein
LSLELFDLFKFRASGVGFGSYSMSPVPSTLAALVDR